MPNSKWQLAPLVALGFGLAATAVNAAPTAHHGTSHTGQTSAAGGAGGHTANAHQTGTMSQGSRKTTGSGTATGNGTVAATLHQAHALLMKGNHDYAGYRAKAAQHVAHALRELGAHQGGSGGASQGRTVGGGGPKGATTSGSGTGSQAASGNGSGFVLQQTQSQSDAQLQQALKLLTGATGQLSNAHAAGQQVQAAIAELNAALKVR